MNVVRLYKDPPSVEVQSVISSEFHPSCSDCALSKNTASPCRKPIGRRGADTTKTLLVVFGYPESDNGRTQAETWFTNLLSSVWNGTVVYDYALKCTPKQNNGGSTTINQSHHNHCRKYLSHVYKVVDPDRVFLLGNHAAKGFLGYDRGGASYCNRGGYTWIYGTKKVPAFLLPELSPVYGNKILRANLKEDLAWACTAMPPEPPLDAVAYDLDPTEDDANFLLEMAYKYGAISYDCETYNRPFDSGFRLLSVGIAFPGTTETIGLFGDALEIGTATQKALVKILKDPAIAKRGQNIVYDLLCIYDRYGFIPTNVVGDSRLAYKLLNSEGDAHLEHLAELIGMGGHKKEANEYVDAAVKKIKKQLKISHPGMDEKFYASVAKSRAYESLPREVNIRYVCRDALSTQLLCEKFERQLEEEYDGILMESYRNELVPISTTFCRMNARGIPLSTDMVKSVVHLFETELSAIETELSQYGDVNPTSAQSKANFVYNILKISPPKNARTAAGNLSVDKKILSRLSTKHPAISSLLKHAEYSKLISMMRRFLMDVHSDGRLRPSFIADGTESGRISATGGLHQVPVRTENGKTVKQCFVARDGYVILQADYSTLEIRTAAILSGDPLMIEVLKSGIDFHMATAKMLGPIIWHKSPEEIQELHNSGVSMYRIVCKTINFATLYGQSVKALSENLTGLLRESGELSDSEVFSEEQAQRAQEAILGKYTVLRDWIAAQQVRCRKYGDAWSWWEGKPSRRRALYDIASEDRGDLRSSAAISSYNTPIQGTGAKFCNMSLILLDELMLATFGDDAYPIHQVHDSIISEVKDDPDIIREVVALKSHVMTGWPSNGVPMVVDFEIGKSWGKMSKLKTSNLEK